MNPETILSELGFSKTRTRMHILEVLVKSSVPLSGGEIIKQIMGRCDKSTVYRTLNALYERSVLQRIIIDHEVKYAIRANHRSGKMAETDHVHFKCLVCGQVCCLKNLIVEDFKLPDGFEKTENQFLIIGTCKSCKTKA